MTSTRLALRNILGSAFRSSVVLLCALLMAGFTVGATWLINSARQSLAQSLDRLGADIVVLPWGVSTDRYTLRGAMFTGVDTDDWMPRSYVQKLVAVPGVMAVSPQLHVTTLHDWPGLPQGEVFVVAYDPASDFSLRPWYPEGWSPNLGPGEALAGGDVYSAAGVGDVGIYDYRLAIVQGLQPTGTALDRTIFVTFDTAEAMARNSQVGVEQKIRVPPGGVSSALVKVSPGASPSEVTVAIMRAASGVVPMESTDLYQTHRDHILGLLRSASVLLVTCWALAVALVGLVFAIAANERRREIGMLRALGAGQGFVLRSLLTEGLLLALAGGVLGVALAGIGTQMLRPRISELLGSTFPSPSPGAMLALATLGMALTIGSITAAAYVPASRISRQEAAQTMRE